MGDDPVEEIARGAARRLAAEYGPRLETDVEAALYDRGGTRGIEQYDPVAVASLIVGIAQLAWMIYSDHRKKPRDVVERTLRAELRHQVYISPNSAQITDVIIHEIVQRMPDDQDP
ncbi:MAG: hypothetical protein JO345_35375 [Streptosporangiaceae bacterium]|nr:hypothetical protein [Streptosporangiaceae bacterium]